MTTATPFSQGVLQDPRLLLIDCKTGYFSRYRRFGKHPICTDNGLRLEDNGTPVVELGGEAARLTLEMIRKDGA